MKDSEPDKNPEKNNVNTPENNDIMAFLKVMNPIYEVFKII